MKKLILILFMLISSGAHAEQWLCVADSAVGFYPQQGNQWEPVTFKTDNSRYVIKRPDGDGWDWTFGVYEFGTDSILYTCKTSLSDFRRTQRLECGRSWDTFIFHRDLLKYVSAYSMMSSGDAPSLEIGTCSSL